MILQEQIPRNRFISNIGSRSQRNRKQLSPKVEDAILAIINKIHELIKQIKS